MIGDGAGDRLPNPPGGVGRELVAAGVLELVDCPHQAGVAFLDQIEEAHAAVAVALGDGDHQAEVPGGQLPLGGVVLAGGGLDPHQRRRERGGAFQGNPHQVAELLAKLCRPGQIVLVAAGLGQLPADGIHAAGNLPQLLQDGWNRCVRRPISSTRRTALTRRPSSRARPGGGGRAAAGDRSPARSRGGFAATNYAASAGSA